MVDLVRLFSSEGKGSRSSYRPPAGTRCLISGPNQDNDSGYVYGETTVLWRNDTFVLYGNDGCWPVLHKWEHVIAKPLTAREKSDGPVVNPDGAGAHSTGGNDERNNAGSIPARPSSCTTCKGARRITVIRIGNEVNTPCPDCSAHETSEIRTDLEISDDQDLDAWHSDR